MKPNYDRVSYVYDLLAFLVFGNKLEKAKSESFQYIKKDDHILIVGGGTGSVLEKLNELGFNCKVDFLDLSEKMLSRAKNRKTDNISVKFKKADILAHTEGNYDIILTNFFFDQFTSNKCVKIILHLKSLLKENGLVLYADFSRPTNLFNRLLVNTMYLFFNAMAKLDKVQLINHKAMFAQLGFISLKTISTKSFIITDVYKLKKEH